MTYLAILSFRTKVFEIVGLIYCRLPIGGRLALKNGSLIVLCSQSVGKFSAIRSVIEF